MTRDELLGLLLLVFALASPGPCLAQEAETEHYRVWSDAGAGLAESVAARMEEMYSLYGQLVGEPSTAPKQRLSVRIYASQEDCAAYMKEAHGLTADRFRYVHYKAGSPKNVVVGWHVPDAALYARLRHEGFHQYFRQFVDRPPTWLNEGLAELLEVSQPTAGKLEISLNDAMLRRLREGIFGFDQGSLRKKGYKRIELRKLVRMSKKAWLAQEGSAYCQSWALVHYMLMEDDRRWARQLVNYINGLRTNSTEAENLEAAFESGFSGLDFGSLYSGYSAWLERTRSPGAKHYQAANAAFKSRGYEAACEELDRALAANPRNPRYRYLRSEARYSLSRFAEAQQDILVAIEEAPEDELYYLTLGKILTYRKQWGAAKWALEVAARGGLERHTQRYLAKIPSGTRAQPMPLTTLPPASGQMPTGAPVRERTPPGSGPAGYTVGDAVAALWSNGKWYSAKVTSVGSKGYGVLYDDGSKESAAPADRLRPLAKPGDLVPGDRVLAVWKKAQMWPAVVDSVSSTDCVVRWDDGTGVKRVPYDKVCKRPEAR